MWGILFFIFASCEPLKAEAHSGWYIGRLFFFFLENGWAKNGWATVKPKLPCSAKIMCEFWSNMFIFSLACQFGSCDHFLATPFELYVSLLSSRVKLMYWKLISWVLLSFLYLAFKSHMWMEVSLLKINKSFTTFVLPQLLILANFR